MLNQLLRFALVSSALVWLKPRWRALLALAAFVVMVQVLHREYLGYVALSGHDDYLLLSYILKWLGLSIGLLVYYLVAIVGLRVPGRRASAEPADADAPATPATVKSAADDGFDFLRTKKVLRGEAQQLLDEDGN